MAFATCADPRPRPDPLPIDGQLGAIQDALAPQGATLLLQAPPGAGKTTRVPLALLASLDQGARLLLVEPRRLAARAAAERLARGLQERVGERVGYSVRLESRQSTRTRLLVVTPGVFLRMLQADPALEGVAVVVFDEVHERRADTDLALALVRQARCCLCPELRLLLMSATLDLEPLAAALDGATVLTSRGRSHPVEVVHQPPRPEEPLERQVVRALESWWLPDREPGETALVFVPGQREIRAAERAITSQAWARDLDCVPLHAQLSLEAQSTAIGAARGPAGKVVLATAIAESSLTLAGVRLVVDSGLSRQSRFDPSTGMDGLVTVVASQASAEQRRGRAGRLGPGRCVRLWSASEQQRRPAFTPAEILTADPLPLALELLAWGAGLGHDLPWLDPPPPGPLAQAGQVLDQLGAVERNGRISAHGRALARLGLHPRLGHMLLLAEREGWLALGAALAALLSERDPLAGTSAGGDLRARVAWLCQPSAVGGPGGEEHRRRPLRRLRRELEDQVTRATGRRPAPTATGDTDPAIADPEGRVLARLVGWAWPEWIASARGQGDGRFLMCCGRGASVPSGDPLASAAGLAIAAVDGAGSEARVRLAAPLDRSGLEALAEAALVVRRQARWDPEGERVRCEEERCFGAIVLGRAPWPDAPLERIREALLQGLESMGLEALPWTPDLHQLRQRLALAHRHLGAPWPDARLETLRADLGGWLGPYLDDTMRSRADLQRLPLADALWGPCDGSLRQRLRQLLPTQLPVPSGRTVALTYDGDGAVLAVKLQEMFGQRHLPRLLEGHVPLVLHLLSPAGRPVAITSDLERFWSQGYPAVRRDLRGRYPRHPWPEDPLRATPTALSKARLQALEERAQK
ncbi:MAG: ATP-dependent helicase HrpB [Cyanobacteriota bacterium]|nr:ATP-dependent helicase HrpB [Cyanobacteriota bacterium]